jgi:hypothetical protein
MSGLAGVVAWGWVESAVSRFVYVRGAGFLALILLLLRKKSGSLQNLLLQQPFVIEGYYVGPS